MFVRISSIAFCSGLFESAGVPGAARMWLVALLMGVWPLSPAASSEFFGLQHSGLVSLDGLEIGGVSADGLVLAGTYELPPEEQPPCPPNADCAVATEAFRWSESGGTDPIRPAGFPPGALRRSEDISADGRSLLVYGRTPSLDSPERSFLWSFEGGLTDFGTTVEEGITKAAVASGLSGDGAVVVGSFGSGLLCELCAGDFEAFRWTRESGVTLLGDLPGGSRQSFGKALSGDGTVIAGTGTSTGNVGNEAFRWTEETGMVGLGFMDDREQTRATDISASGEVIVGYGHGRLLPPIAFRWSEEDGIEAIGPGIPTAVTADGATIVGNFNDEGAFVWQWSRGVQPLEEVLMRDFGLRDGIRAWTLESISDISADGTTLVGIGTNPAGARDIWIARRVPGDYTGDGIVDQADLNLVLLHWGAGALSVPDVWTANPPRGVIDQEELSGVLVNWGGATAPTMASAAAIPEPYAAVLLLVSLLAIVTRWWPHRL